MTDTYIRPFSYRHPRFAMEAAVDFIFGDKIVVGECISISEAGLCARFDEELADGMIGTVTLYHGTRSYSVRAVVSQAAAFSAALAFKFEASDNKHPLQALLSKSRSLPAT